MKEIITKYERLKSYSLWYYFRYYPSNKKLENKLLEKTENNIDLVNIVIGDIEHLFIEDEIINLKIKNFLFKNKNLSYIRQKLLEKQFNKTSVETILSEQFLVEGESLLQKQSIIKKIIIFNSKLKSINYIKNKLIERPEDVDIVNECIDEIYTNQDYELENLSQEFEKIKNKYTKNKIIEKLLRKGFNYSDIKNLP